MSKKKIDFSELSWERSAVGIKSKSSEQNGKKLRLVDLSKELEHPDWCEVGHIGFVVEGEIEIAFNNEIIRYSTGDALIIPSGVGDKHIPKPLSDKVILFLIEEV